MAFAAPPSLQNMQIAAIDYWALASALGGTLMIATMIWIVVLDRRASH
jgi:hypothetical protein